MRTLGLGRYWVKLSDTDYQEVEIVKIIVDYVKEKGFYETFCEDKDGDRMPSNILYNMMDGKIATAPSNLLLNFTPKCDGYAMEHGNCIHVTKMMMRAEKTNDSLTFSYLITDDNGNRVDVDSNNVYESEKVCKAMEDVVYTDIDGKERIEKGLLKSIKLTDEQNKLADEFAALIGKMQVAGIKICTTAYYDCIELYNETQVDVSFDYDHNEIEQDVFFGIEKYGRLIKHAVYTYSEDYKAKITRK